MSKKTRNLNVDNMKATIDEVTIKQEPSVKDIKEYVEINAKTEEVKEVFELNLQMHKKIMIEGDFLIENVGGGDVQVNGRIICKGDIVRVSGNILLYATSYPRVKITKV